jgi:hypothetical protein
MLFVFTGSAIAHSSIRMRRHCHALEDVGSHQGGSRHVVQRYPGNVVVERLYIEKQHIHDEDVIPCLEPESVPSLSHLRLVVLGDSESAGLSIVRLSMDPRQIQ